MYMSLPLESGPIRTPSHLKKITPQKTKLIQNMVSVYETEIKRNQIRLMREKPLWRKLCRFSGANFSAIFF